MGELLSGLPEFLNNIWLYGIVAFAVITAVIFIHELGHYGMARLLGIPAEIFSIGFGRELIGRTDRHGTRWSLRIFPIGGYVRFFGETITKNLEALPPEEHFRVYARKPVWKRALVAASGPGINLLFSLLLLAGVYAFLGRPTPPPIVAGVEVDSPAEAMDIQIGDRIVSIGGTQVTGIDQARDLVRHRAGDTLQVEVERKGSVLTLTGVPKNLTEENEYGIDTQRGYFGWMWPSYGLAIKEMREVGGQNTTDNPDKARQILLAHAGREVVICFGKDRTYMRVLVRPELNQALKDPAHKDFGTFTPGRRPMEDMKTLPLMDAIRYAGELTMRGVHTTFGTVFKIFAGNEKITEMGGVIKISSTTGQMVEKGIFSFLSFVALLSVSIAAINLLPLPLLDGGHLLFLALEAVKGKPVSLRTKGYIYGFGLIFLLSVLFVISVNDMISLFNSKPLK